jgi:hypothetical protein
MISYFAELSLGAKRERDLDWAQVRSEPPLAIGEPIAERQLMAHCGPPNVAKMRARGWRPFK